MAIFDHAGQKIIESTISFPEFPSPSKKQFTPSAHAFDHAPPQNYQAPYDLYEFVPTCKTSVHSICSFFRYNHFLSPETRLVTPTFDHTQPKKF